MYTMVSNVWKLKLEGSSNKHRKISQDGIMKMLKDKPENFSVFFSFRYVDFLGKIVFKNIIFESIFIEQCNFHPDGDKEAIFAISETDINHDFSLSNCNIMVSEFKLMDCTFHRNIVISNNKFSCKKILFNKSIFSTDNNSAQEKEISKISGFLFSKNKLNVSIVSFFDTNWINKEVRFEFMNFGFEKFLFRKVKNTSFYFKEMSFEKIDLSIKEICGENILVFIGCVFFKNTAINTNGSCFKKLRFDICTIDSSLDIREAAISDEGILSFSETINKGYIILDWNKCKNNVLNQGKGDATDSLSRQLAMLRLNFHNQGLYAEEDDCFAEYKWQKALEGKHKKKYLTFIWNMVFNLAGKYGTKPGRIIIALFGFIFIFAIIFFFVSDTLTLTLPSKCWPKFFQALYFSAITFLTIGYGDISPTNGWMAFFAGLEGLTGFTMMSYLTVSIVRKIMR